MVIGLIGEKLAGKDTAAEYLIQKYGAVHVRTSKILDELLDVLGLPQTRQNEIDAGKGMEQVFGARVIGEAVKKRVAESKAEITVINGLRFPDQFADAQELGAKIIYITAPAEVRFKRLQQRVGKNKDEFDNLAAFVAQDNEWSEKNIPVLGAKADYKIENISGHEDLHNQLDTILTEIRS